MGSPDEPLPFIEIPPTSPLSPVDELLDTVTFSNVKEEFSE